MVRIAFFGTSEFAVPALCVCAPEVVCVVTQPDRPSGRGLKLRSSPVKQAAQELGLQVVSPEKCRSPEFVQYLREQSLDLLVVAAYGQILSQSVLDSARKGGINLHGSILPWYRGAAPIQRAILNGESETGVTLMQMDKGMDTGDIIDIRRTQIGMTETYGELQTRLADIAAQQLADWLPKIADGNYGRTPQNHDVSTLAPKISKLESELDLHSPADQEFNRYRAFTPSPGASIGTIHGPLRLLRVRRADLHGQPGEICSVNPLVIAFSSGSLELQEVQPAGRQRMSGTAFANGARWTVGTSILRTSVEQN